MNNNFLPPYGANYGGYGGFNNNYRQSNTFAYVNGIEGAKAYIVPPNSTTVLLDSEKPMLYIKTADMYGRAELKVFKYEEYKEPQQAASVTAEDYATKQEINDLRQELTALKQELTKNNEELTGSVKE